MVIDDTGSVEDIHAFIYCKKWRFGQVLPMPDRQTDSQRKDRATQLLIKYKSGALVTQCTEMVNILGKDLLASATSAYTVLKSAFVLSSIVVLSYILFCPLISKHTITFNFPKSLDSVAVSLTFWKYDTGEIPNNI